MDDDNLTFLDDDDAEIPVIGGGTTRTLKGGAFTEAGPRTPPVSASVPQPVPRAPVTSLGPVPKPPSAAFNLAAQLEQDKKDLDVAAAKLPSRTDVEGTADVRMRIDGMLDSAIAESGVTLPDEDLANRYHAISKTYFRGLRDALETKSKLTMPVASGGLGMAEEDAEKVVALFTAKLSSFQDALLQEKKGEKARFVAKAAEKHLDDGGDVRVVEQRGLDRKYQDITGKDRLEGMRPAPMPVGTPVKIEVREDAATAPRMPSVADVVAEGAKRRAGGVPVVQMPSGAATEGSVTEEAASPGAAEPLDALDQPKLAPPPPNLPFAAGEAPVPETPAPAPAASAPRLVGREPVPSVPSMVPPSASLVATKPSPPPAATTPMTADAPKPSSSTANADARKSSSESRAKPPAPPTKSAPPAPAAPGTRPVVADVKPAATRLTGPIEELHSFSLIDFRRLSKDPKERILKIKDKIDLLEDESFEMKTRGMDAWRTSPVNRCYLDMLRKSLEGKPVPDVITEMDAAGEDVLSKEEFDAIMELNRSLRFG